MFKKKKKKKTYSDSQCCWKKYSDFGGGWQGVFNATLCDKVCQWLATGRWFSPGTPVSSPNKTDHHNITEILLKMVERKNDQF
jgi:hypothetical protein